MYPRFIPSLIQESMFLPSTNREKKGDVNVNRSYLGQMLFVLTAMQSILFPSRSERNFDKVGTSCSVLVTTVGTRVWMSEIIT